MPTAQEYKELGNKAFSAKDFEEAIKHYSAAIKLDPKNHVYYSNRSASYASVKKYTEAISDAKQCIRHDLTFIKGYYRLASAQLENGDLAGVTTTCKQGLNVDPGNKQLEKLMRQAKARIASDKKLKAKMNSNDSGSGAGAGAGAGAGGFSDANKELMDLQNQYRKSVNDYNLVQTSIQHSDKVMKMNKITLDELEGVPSDENRKMYTGIGKAFLMQTRDEVFDDLNDDMKDAEKKMEDLKQKKEYLERRMESQKKNIIECASGQ